MKYIFIITLLFITACGSHSHEIQPAYISSMEYQDYSCKQIAQEMTIVSRRANTLAGDIDKNADNDAAVMGAGLILFWPALFFLDGDHPGQQQYAELQGRMNALEEAAVQKSCDISVKNG